MNIEKWLVILEQNLLDWSLRLLAALAIFFIGRWIAQKLVQALVNLMERRAMDPTITRFLQNVANAILLVVIIIAALNSLGIATTSMLAVLGAAGLAIGLALKDSLSNIASGVLMVAFRPFHVGDFVSAAGVEGRVEKIAIFYTELRTIDNKLAIVPNSLITGGVITNFTDDDKRRLELNIGVGYNSDIPAARQLLLNMLKNHPRVLKDPEPIVGVTAFADSSINIVLRPWVLADDFWAATFELHEAIKQTLEENNIEMPFPQRVVRMIRDGGAS